MRNISAFLLLLSLSNPASASPLSIDKMAEISEVLSSNPVISSTFDLLEKKNFSFMGIVNNQKVSYCDANELQLLFSKWSYEGKTSTRKDKVVKVEYSDCNGSPIISIIES